MFQAILPSLQENFVKNKGVFKIKVSSKIVNRWKPLIIFAKSSVLDVWQITKYISEKCLSFHHQECHDTLKISQINTAIDIINIRNIKLIIFSEIRRHYRNEPRKKIAKQTQQKDAFRLQTFFQEKLV